MNAGAVINFRLPSYVSLDGGGDSVAERFVTLLASLRLFRCADADPLLASAQLHGPPSPRSFLVSPGRSRHAHATPRSRAF